MPDFEAELDFLLWDAIRIFDNRRRDWQAHFGNVTDSQLLQIAIMLETVRLSDLEERAIKLEVCSTLPRYRAVEIIETLSALDEERQPDPKRQILYFFKMKTLI